VRTARGRDIVTVGRVVDTEKGKSMRTRDSVESWLYIMASKGIQ
jgi:hypothetical protein